MKASVKWVLRLRANAPKRLEFGVQGHLFDERCTARALLLSLGEQHVLHAFYGLVKVHSAWAYTD